MLSYTTQRMGKGLLPYFSIVRFFSTHREELPRFLTSNRMMVLVLGTNEQKIDYRKVLIEINRYFFQSHGIDGVGSENHSGIKKSPDNYFSRKLLGLGLGRGTGSNTREAVRLLNQEIIQLTQAQPLKDGQKIRIFLAGMSRGCITVYDTMRHFSQTEIYVEFDHEKIKFTANQFEIIASLIDPVMGIFPRYSFRRWNIPDNVIRLDVHYALLERRLFFEQAYLIVNTDTTNVSIDYYLGAHSCLHGRKDAPETAQSKLVKNRIINTFLENNEQAYPGLGGATDYNFLNSQEIEQLIHEIADKNNLLQHRQGRYEYAHDKVSYYLTYLGLDFIVNRRFETLDRSPRALLLSNENATVWLKYHLYILGCRWFKYHQYKSLERQIDEKIFSQDGDLTFMLKKTQKIVFRNSDIGASHIEERQVPIYGHYRIQFFQNKKPVLIPFSAAPIIK